MNTQTGRVDLESVHFLERTKKYKAIGQTYHVTMYLALAPNIYVVEH